MPNEGDAPQEQQKGKQDPTTPLIPTRTNSGPNPENPHGQGIHNRSNSDPEEPEKWFHNPDWHMVWLTTALFAIGIFTARVFHKQFKEMKAQTEILNEQAKQAAADSIEAGRRIERQMDLAGKQVAAAQDGVKAIQRQMRQDQRAWLSVRPYWPPGKDAKGEVVATVVQLTPDAPLSVPMRITVSGKTAAKKIFATFFVDVVKATDEPNLDGKNPYWWRFSAGLIQPNDPPNDFLAYRQRAGKGLDTMSKLTETELRELQSGDAYLVVYGKMWYRDIFNTLHWAKYCYPMPLNFTPKYYNFKDCTDYNSTDNN
jgi:hypothetical protein